MHLCVGAIGRLCVIKYYGLVEVVKGNIVMKNSYSSTGEGAQNRMA
jgi:hypothetical protein